MHMSIYLAVGAYSLNKNYANFTNDQRCEDEYPAPEPQGTDLPGAQELVIWSVNVKACGARPKALVDELDDIKSGACLNNSHRYPLVIAQQDLSPYQAFRGIPDSNCWYSSDRPITEKDYENIKKQGAWMSRVNKTPAALLELGAVLVDAQSILAQTGSASFTPGLETLHLSHDAIIKTGQLGLKNSNELRKCHRFLEEVRDYVNLTEELISSAIPDIHPDDHAQAIKAARILTMPAQSGFLHPQFNPNYFMENRHPEDRNKGLVATLTLTTLTGTLSIHNVYNRNLTIDVDLLADYIENFKGDAILPGDFNLHHPLWSGEGRGNVTSQSELFADRIVGMGLELQTKRGEITWSNSQDTEKRSSTIDHTFASPKLCPLIQSCKPLAVAGFQSDHRPIQTVVRKYVEQDIRIKICYDRADQDKFKNCLEQHLSLINNSLATEDDINQYFVDIITKVNTATKQCVPTKTCGFRISQKAKEVNSKLQNLSQTIEAMKQREGSTYITSQIKQLQREKSRLYNEIWRGLTERKLGTTKGLFHMAGLAKRISQPIPQTQVPTLKSDTEIAYDADTKVELMKKTKFRDMYEDFSTRRTSPPPQPPEPKSPVPISEDLTEEELRAILKDIKTGKSTGEDEIPNEAIRLGQKALFPYLLSGFRVCIRLRTHPDCFKKAIIVMIVKTGKDPNHPDSYRPITLLSHIGKFYEKIIANKITRAIRKGPDMLPPTQFGGKSTTEALLYMINVIHDAWFSTRDKVVTILSLDMSGAFDNVLRQKVLEEMARIGLPAWIVETVASFLSNRDAKMRMPGIVSDEFELNTGIPQGSPLSPILFLIFAAPLLNDLGSHLGMQKICTNEGKDSWVDLYAFAFVDDIYFIAVSHSYLVNCEGITLLHTKLIDIAQRLCATFGAPKYHIMHMQSPYERKRHNNEMPNIPGLT
ncbi:RNA-directed DNA polymerase from mobile element jockey [Fusarium culmorum]|uniref:RNA-directed DNA polymerase from mobile element jockey n=1 Tax=Fusarium culmorum TaxID=5516 RepID=A0A2T4GS49_FUSCU|nr:RNA-directed DNA polymerase from mobile element jockey [Fusarium culmorum]